MTKLTLTSSFILILAVGFFVIAANGDRPQSQTKLPIIHSPWSLQEETQKQKKIPPLNIEEALNSFLKFCSDELEKTDESLPKKEMLLSYLKNENLKRAHLNIHLKDSQNQLLFLRVTNNKLQLFKNHDGKEEKMKDELVNKLKTSEEIIKEYSEEGVPVFIEESYLLKEDQQSVLFEFTNGEFTRIEVNSPKKSVSCQSPY